jgi:hypothetical protein
MGAFVEDVWYLRLQCTFFQAHYFSILSFFHNFKERLKATALTWSPGNDSVTHKYLVEMRRLACDETPFLSSMQPRAITTRYVIPLDIHGHDRSARDETSYPLTNLL